MPNETLQKILQQREIKTTDDIIFRTIFDVLSALFTDENHLSTLKSGYTINDHQQVWLVNIPPPIALLGKLKRVMPITLLLMEHIFINLIAPNRLVNEKNLVNNKANSKLNLSLLQN